MQAGASTKSFGHYLSGAWQHVLPNPGKRKTLATLGEALKRFDLVCLQEADGGSTRSGLMHQAYWLADYAGFKYVADQRNRRIGVRQIAIACSGNAILSRAPLHNIILHPLPGGGRGLLQVDVHSEAMGRFRLYNLHLSLGSLARTKQLIFLRELLSAQDASLPSVICGDFNCEPGFHALQTLCEQLQLELADTPASFPAWQPKLRIDLMLHSPALRLKNIAALDNLGSDHLALHAELSRSC